jgi:hypothetical protein
LLDDRPGHFHVAEADAGIFHPVRFIDPGGKPKGEELNGALGLHQRLDLERLGLGPNVEIAEVGRRGSDRGKIRGGHGEELEVLGVVSGGGESKAIPAADRRTMRARRDL